MFFKLFFVKKKRPCFIEFCHAKSYTDKLRLAVHLHYGNVIGWFYGRHTPLKISSNESEIRFERSPSKSKERVRETKMLYSVLLSMVIYCVNCCNTVLSPQHQLQRSSVFKWTQHFQQFQSFVIKSRNITPQNGGVKVNSLTLLTAQP